MIGILVFAVSIVLPEMPTVSESFAAKELKYHLEKATGETISIVAEGESVGRDDPIAPHASTSNLVGRDDPIAPSAGSCGLPVRRFYVGNTKALANAGIDYASLQAEERLIKGVGGNVYLAGGELPGFDEIVKSEKFRTSYGLAGGGTLYAVYDFLENEMGVKWIWPGELGEVIPMRGIPNMDGVERRGREPLLKRELRGNLEGMRRITIANRLWGWKDPANARREVERRELWMTRNRCGYRRKFNFGHAFVDWYRRCPDHPECFAMQPSGLRGRFADLPQGADGNKYYPLCVSNPDVHDRIVKDWTAGLVGRDVPIAPLPYVNCCENDAPGFCTCASCRAWDAPDPRFAAHPYWNGKIKDVTSRNRFFMAKAQWGDEGAALEKIEPPSVSDRYVRFYNAVLEKARAVDSLAEVCAYAYANYASPPKEARVADGVVLAFVPNIMFPYSSAGSDEFRACWLGWNKSGATQMVYRPNYMFGGANMPYSAARRMAADVNFAFAHGMVGVDHDSLLGAWSAQAMKNYVAARLLREPDAPYRKLAVEFVSAFGAAARDVAEYCLMLDAIDDKFAGDELGRICAENPSKKGSPGGGWRNFVTIVADLYSEEWFAKADAVLAAAEAKVGGVEKARVEFLRKGLRDGLLTFRTRVAQKGGDQAAFDAAFSEMVNYRASVEADNVCAWAWFADMEEEVAGWPHATQGYRSK